MQIMRQIIGPTLALLIAAGPVHAGLRGTGQYAQERAVAAMRGQQVAQSNKTATHDKRDAKAESRSGYHGDTSSKHGNAKFPERPESQHGHGSTSGGPQH